MAMLIHDALFESELIAKRREMGWDQHDEVWDGTHVVYAPKDNEHQYRLDGGQLRLVGTSTPNSPDVLRSDVLLHSFRLITGDARPQIEVIHHDGAHRWLV